MDDFIFLEWMKVAYEVVEENNRNIDDKSIRMITIIGAMFTIQATLTSYLICNPPVHILIIFLASLLSYLFSCILFICSISIRKFEAFPTNDSIIHTYEKNFNEEDFVNGFLGDYNEALKNNENILAQKGQFACWGFFFFSLGLIMLMVFIILLLI